MAWRSSAKGAPVDFCWLLHSRTFSAVFLNIDTLSHCTSRFCVVPRVMIVILECFEVDFRLMGFREYVHAHVL